MDISISVVFPMFNEEGYVRNVVTGTINSLKDIIDDYEIIIIEDASTDNSGQIADELSYQNPRIKVLHHKVNRKLGGSLKTGFNMASKELVLYSDIDMPFDLKEIKTALELFFKEKADFVSAYRSNRKSDGIKRYIYSKIYNIFINIIFGLNIKDVNFSFKLIKAILLKSLGLFSEGSFIDAEMLIKANRKGARIIQFGTLYYPRLKGTSRLSNISTIVKILQEALIFRLMLFKENIFND